MTPEAAMRLALAQARRVRGRTHPNPPVGAVVFQWHGHELGFDGRRTADDVAVGEGEVIGGDDDGRSRAQSAAAPVEGPERDDGGRGGVDDVGDGGGERLE